MRCVTLDRMARTSAERQRAYRQREAERRAERDRLRAEVQHQAAEIERLTADLAEARDNGKVPHCPTHGSVLACPQCYRDSTWD